MGEKERTEEECQYMDVRRDCDGDYDFYCHNWNGTCEHKKPVRDCDGDVILLCRK